MSSGRSPSRRAVLTAAAAGLTSAAGLGVFGYWLLHKEIPAAPADVGAALTTSPSAPKPVEPVVTQQVQSAARGSSVELIVIRPDGVDQADLPVCLALHGRGASAQMYVELGVPEMLTAVVAAGGPPFAVVAVDGGDSYWVAADPADDPQRMLAEEIPGWLTAAGLRPKPAAVMGISMGAYGALNYARTNPGLGAVVAISPALFASWNDAKARSVFSGRPQWEDTEPLRHTENLKSDTLAVWCGSADPFAPVARQLIAKVKPTTAVIGPGGHDAPYWRKVLPDVLGFVGSHV